MSLDVSLRMMLDTGGEQPHEVLLYDANITHNLIAMASEAGIYYALWRPGEMKAPDISARIQAAQQAGNYHGAGGAFELEDLLPTVYARDIIEPLRSGLALLRADPERFEKHNSPNGWGLYKNFVPFVAKYLAACERHPLATVRVCR